MPAEVDIILGAARGLEYPRLQPFVESLRRTGFDGELSIFTSGVSAETLARLRAGGALVHPFREPHLRVYPRWRLYFYDDRISALHPLLPLAARAAGKIAGDGSRIQHAVARRLMGVWCSRYFLYYDYLRARPNAYRRVMITDLKDVVFQRNPFEAELDSPLNCFLESRRYLIGTCGINRRLVETAYGSEELARLAGEPISCSGVTIGSQAGMLEYLRLMTRSLMRLRRQYGGLDQGVHNHLLHTGAIPGAKTVENDRGAVMTLGYVLPGEMVFDDEGRLLDCEGRIVPVLHQYDRHPELAERVRVSLAGVAA
jgi:hypothetical protein